MAGESEVCAPVFRRNAAGEAAAPGMLGMSALGVPLERALERAAGRRRGSGGNVAAQNAQDASNTEAAPELTGRSQNGYPLAEGEFEVPVGSRSGQVFLGLDGELYVNDEGVRRPFLRDSDAGLAEENAEGASARESSEESAEEAGAEAIAEREAGAEGIAEREAGAEPVVEATVDEEIPAGPQEGAALGEDIADTDVQAMDIAPQSDAGFDENLEGTQGLEGEGDIMAGEPAALAGEEGAEGSVSERNDYNIRNPDFSFEHGASSLNLESQDNPESQVGGGENISGRVEDSGNAREAERRADAEAFRADLGKFRSGELPTYKILRLGKPSEILLADGVPDAPITLRQSVIKKILEKHGLGYGVIESLPEAMEDPVGIFSYPNDKDVRDVLLEMRDNAGRSIIASLKINVSAQRYGEVSDLLSVHPKENFGRIYSWIKAGRLRYWNTEKGRRFLQDSAPANWEQYETELSPFLYQASQNYSESQAENRKNISGRVEGGRTSIPEAIRNRVRSILSYFGTLKKGEDVALEYMPVSEKTVRKISEVSGGKVDARGATHVLTSNFIPHVQRRGHFEGNEFSDSLPVTQEDLANIPDIVENWDNITFRNRKSADSITYQKSYPDGTILYVEEVWSGKANDRKSRLASKTIYKRKGSSPVRTTAEAMPYTSETRPTGRTLLSTQSENYSESQAENKKNISGRVGDVRGYVGSVESGAGARLGGRGNVEAAVDSVFRQLGISDNAEARRGNSRIISASVRLLPKSVKFDRSLNRVVGMPSIADVRRYAERALGIPIAKKFRDNPKFIGIFDRKLQVIRTAGGHHNDISVLAHELGHYLDALLFDSRLEQVGGELKSELEGFAEEVFGDGYSSGEKLSEGWAEFVSRVLQNEEAAKARCPVAFALLERRLGSDLQLARVFDNIRQMVALNRGAEAWDRARANIRRRSDREKTPLSQSLKSFARTFRRRLIDSNEAIVEFSRKLSPKAGERLRAYLDNYVGGHKGQSEYSINVAQLDLDGNEIGKSLSACVNDNLSTAFERENIGAYLVARRAVAYFAKNPEGIARCREMFGLEYADCKTICEEATPGMRACASDIYQFQKNDLKMGLEAGIFSKAQYDSLMANDAYVPLQRFMEFLNPATGKLNAARKFRIPRRMRNARRAASAKTSDAPAKVREQKAAQIRRAPGGNLLRLYRLEVVVENLEGGKMGDFRIVENPHHFFVFRYLHDVGHVFAGVGRAQYIAVGKLLYIANNNLRFGLGLPL